LRDNLPERLRITFNGALITRRSKNLANKVSDGTRLVSLLRLGEFFGSLISRQSRFPPARDQRQIDVSSFCSGGRLIRSPKRKELPLTAKLETGIPFFRQSAFAINRLRLAENGILPECDICLWKVAKIPHFLASFSIHPCTFMNPHEPMLSTADQLVKPVYRLHDRSLRVKPAHLYNLTTDQKVVCSNHAGCKALIFRHFVNIACLQSLLIFSCLHTACTFCLSKIAIPAWPVPCSSASVRQIQRALFVVVV
jgi:hypothetical protein